MTATIAEAPASVINRNATNDRARLLERLVRVSETPTREQAWVWSGRIPAGEITAILGPKGAAKSYLVAEIAAKVSSGDPWPDEPEKRRTPGDVLYISAEDELVEGIKPRLVACGADLGKIHHFDARMSKDQDGNTLEFGYEDVVRLAEAIPGLALIVIDPFADALEGQNDRRTGVLRQALAELKGLAVERGVGVVLVNAVDKVSAGRSAPQGFDVLPFLQARTRALWSVEQDPGDRRRFFWLPVRTNLACGPLGLGFSIHPLSKKVAWEPEPVQLVPDDLKPRNRPSSNVRRAGAWIQKYLKDGARRAREVLRDAALAGISRGALYEAKSQLDVLSVKETRKKVGCWHWKLAERGQFDMLRDLLDDPKGLEALRARTERSRAPDVGSAQKVSEDQKISEDLVDVRAGSPPLGDGARSPSPAGLRPSTSPAGGEVRLGSAAREDEVGRPAPSCGTASNEGDATEACLRGAKADSRLESSAGRPATRMETAETPSEDQKISEDLLSATNSGQGEAASAPRGDGPWSPSPAGLRPSTSPAGGEVRLGSAAREGGVGTGAPCRGEDSSEGHATEACLRGAKADFRLDGSAGRPATRMKPAEIPSEDQKVSEDLPSATNSGQGQAGSTPRGDGPRSPSPAGLRPSTSPAGGEVNFASAAREGGVGTGAPCRGEASNEGDAMEACLRGAKADFRLEDRAAEACLRGAKADFRLEDRAAESAGCMSEDQKIPEGLSAPNAEASEDQKVPEDLASVQKPAERDENGKTSEDQKIPEDLGGATNSGDGRVAVPRNLPQGKGRRSARGRSSENSKIPISAALRKLERAERLRPAP